MLQTDDATNGFELKTKRGYFSYACARARWGGGAAVRVEPRRSNVTSFSEMAKIGDKHKLAARQQVPIHARLTRQKQKAKMFYTRVSPRTAFSGDCMCLWVHPSPFQTHFSRGSCRGVHCRPGAAFSTADSSGADSAPVLPVKAASRLPVGNLQLLQHREADHSFTSFQLSLYKKERFNGRTIGHI